jgi:hypothetical protein
MLPGRFNDHREIQVRAVKINSDFSVIFYTLHSLLFASVICKFQVMATRLRNGPHYNVSKIAIRLKSGLGFGPDFNSSPNFTAHLIIGPWLLLSSVILSTI